MSIFSDNSVIAKTRTMYGNMLKSKQYEDLIMCKSVPDIAAYLKNHTTYSTILSNVNEVTIHRGQLEVFLKKQAFENYSKIYHYLNNNENDMFKMIIEEFEILEILRMILLLKANNPSEFIVSLPGFLISKCHVNLLKLAKVRSFDDLLTCLNNTHYYKVLFKHKPTHEEPKINYISCEHSMYNHFFKRLYSMINHKAKKSERIELNHLIGTRLDILNICNIYREKVLFKSNPEQIKRRIFPFFRSLTKDKIEEAITSSDSDQLNKLMQNLFANNYEINKISETEVYYIENYASRLKNKLCKHYLHLSNNVSTVFYAFYVLSQIEISNLIYIIEGIRYKVSPNEIKNLLIKWE